MLPDFFVDKLNEVFRLVGWVLVPVAEDAGTGCPDAGPDTWNPQPDACPDGFHVAGQGGAVDPVRERRRAKLAALIARGKD